MEIRIYNDKKEKYQSFEARLYEDDSNELVQKNRYDSLIGYGQDEAEAIANLKELVFQHISELEQKACALAKMDFFQHVECNYDGEKIK